MVRLAARGRGAAIALALWSVTVASSATDSAQARFDAKIADVRAAMLVDPETALTVARSAHRQAISLQRSPARDLAIATSEWLEGEALNRLGKLDVAAPLVAHALSIAKRVAPDGKLLGEILLTSGSIADVTGQIALSLSEFKSAHGIFHRLDDKRNTAASLICIASLFDDANDHASSLSYLKQASDIYSGD